MVNVAIIGATGYGGVELIRLFRNHPEVSLSFLSSETYAGRPVSEVYPHLTGVTGSLRRFDTAAVAAECQFALLCLPAGKSLQIAPRLLEAGVRVVDVSPDFRLHDPKQYSQWYRLDHTAPELLREAAFGIPEWYREAIVSARLVAAPGCYSTAVILALGPLVAEGLIEGGDIIADGKTGVSGAGRTSLRLEYHFPEADEDVTAYSVGGHRHLPEMLQALKEIGDGEMSITWTPHLVPMTRGILMTIYVRPRPGTAGSALREALARRYEAEPFVHVLPEGVWPHTKWTAGTNHCFLAVGLDEATGRAIIVAALDNLGKGYAGQMIQCLNLMAGFEESTGISLPAAYP